MGTSFSEWVAQQKSRDAPADTELRHRFEAAFTAEVEDMITDQFAPGDDEDWPGTDDIERAKGIMDGAVTLAEAAAMARTFADELQRLHEKGYVLREPVRDDYAYYYKPDQET